MKTQKNTLKTVLPPKLTKTLQSEHTMLANMRVKSKYVHVCSDDLWISIIVEADFLKIYQES